MTLLFLNTFESLNEINIYSPQVIAILILAGFMVGFINTIAGSGTVITYSLFMMLGLPANMANGTIRLGVIMQTLASTLNFKRHNALDWRKGFKLALPVVIGSVVGAQIATEINEAVFEKILAGILLIMLFFIFYKPERWLKNQVQKIQSKPTIVQLLLFLSCWVWLSSQPFQQEQVQGVPLKPRAIWKSLLQTISSRRASQVDHSRLYSKTIS